ncbi:calcium-binding protein [Limimaricola sp. G21655-S1]|uniref:calcium-binding protein n=1 Tax=Limimaricola sp. G21655-S1 TaxID=3014768 RepID=UPI0022AEAF4D|nr:calcium-binding protein [Limimaricola sp. G21655-S1]MCZ4260855.1 calcium-binding protein [Limimaricola sp. G21655-S1]
MAISPTNSSESIVYRINAGGGDVAAIDAGPVWTGDLALENASGPVSVAGNVEHEFIGKMTNTEDEVTFTDPAVAAIAPWQLFVHERFDKIRPLPNDDAPLTYNFDVDTGATYKITLLYVENRTGAFRPGNDRVFDVTVDGAAFAEFADLNPLGEAAAALGQELPPTPSKSAAKQPFLGTVVTRELVYSAVDDELSLTFLPDNQNPKINAIQISQILDEITDIALSSNKVAENKPGAAVGELSSVGPDADDGYVFTVSDDRFQVVDGMLKLKSGISLDFEDAYKISLAVTATANGVNVTEVFEIAVQDVAEGWLSALTNMVEGSNAGEKLKGTKANDLILGFAGKDTLIGRKGDDIMAGGKGADKFVGGRGFDTLDYSDSTKGVMVNLQKGSGKGGEARGDKFKSMEGVIGSDANDKLLGSRTGNLLIGGEGDDVLKGRRGSDAFIFGPGNDKMLGGKGHDTVVFDGDVGDYDMSFGKKVTVTLDGDRSVMSGMERLEFKDTTYLREGGIWVDVNAIVLSIADAPPLTETGDTGTTDLAFGLSLDDTGFTGTLQVTYDTGTATNQSQSVSFVNGVGTLVVPVANDDLVNGTETVAVTLTGASGTAAPVTLGTATASGMVTEDDVTAPPADVVLSIADAPTLTETGDTGTTDLGFRLSLDDTGFTGDLQLTYDTGTARNQSQTVSFAGGVGTLVVPVANDDLVNGTETVAVTLTGATGSGVVATLGTATASGMVTEDDVIAIVLSIADAPTLTETGDTGTTDLGFRLSLDDTGFNGTLQVSYDTGTATKQSQSVSFTSGVGTLVVSVPNDDLANGTETVAVTLTGASGTGVAATLGTATAKGMVTEDDVTAPPPQPTAALEAFAAQGDLDTSQSYAAGTVGAAKLGIMLGNTNIEASNFGLNSFKVTNTGDKKISAIFIDVSGALYPDSVFDPDGAGGDSATKPWAVNAAGNTGAYIGGGVGGYFLPGPDPLPNTTGTGKPSNGGYKGAMVKFDPTVSGGFGKNETVGFSGDMDPNSIAGLTKNSLDALAVDGWDVGGISGHELIGSTFTVLFDDGTTASGQLGSDGSASGSHAIATQNGAGAVAPTLSVNGVGAGGTGSYGGSQPSVIVSGTPGDTVMVTLTKGFNPVQGTGDIPALVENRLDAYAFKANNTFDNQHVVVKLNSSGIADLSHRFDYDESPANSKADGTFPGDDVSPIGFVAAVVDPANGNAPISPITKPIYLTNQGGPVSGDPSSGPEGYFQIVNSGADGYFKIQIEDENGTGGISPGGKWTYHTAPDAAGRQTNFQGNGYYLFGSNTSTAIDNNVDGTDRLEYTIYVPETDLGTYKINFAVSRDGLAAGDQQNDLWLNFKPAGQAGNGDILSYMPANARPEPHLDGFVKVYGGSNNGNWSQSFRVDGQPNYNASVTITEAGLYTVQVEGRSQGYHVDYFELYKGSDPASSAANSAFVAGIPGNGGGDGGGDGGGNTGGDIFGTIVTPIGASSDDWEQFGGGGSKDLEFGLNGSQPQAVGMRFDGIDIPQTAIITDAYLQFTAFETSSGAANLTIGIQGSESAATFSSSAPPQSRVIVDEFAWSNVEQWTAGGTYRTPDISELIETVIGADGASNAALAFIVAGSGSRVASSFNNGDAPELVLVLDDGSTLTM